MSNQLRGCEAEAAVLEAGGELSQGKSIEEVRQRRRGLSTSSSSSKAVVGGVLAVVRTKHRDSVKKKAGGRYFLLSQKKFQEFCSPTKFIRAGQDFKACRMSGVLVAAFSLRNLRAFWRRQKRCCWSWLLSSALLSRSFFLGWRLLAPFPVFSPNQASKQVSQQNEQ